MWWTNAELHLAVAGRAPRGHRGGAPGRAGDDRRGRGGLGGAGASLPAQAGGGAPGGGGRGPGADEAGAQPPRVASQAQLEEVRRPGPRRVGAGRGALAVRGMVGAVLQRDPGRPVAAAAPRAHLRLHVAAAVRPAQPDQVEAARRAQDLGRAPVARSGRGTGARTLEVELEQGGRVGQGRARAQRHGGQRGGAGPERVPTVEATAEHDG